jgi:exonuclease SbcC
MLLKKIKLTNIRSYKNLEVEFPTGSTLLSGDIGSGKTSVLLAIEFSLFGLQPGQRGNSLLRNGEDEGGTVLEFEVDGKDIVVERKLKRGKSISQDSCSIIIDGVKRELSVTELKNAILELLNYPGEFSKKQNILYKFTVYTPQEEMKQIILQDPATRINTLRHVFGIDKYKRIIENTSILTSKLREEKRKKEGITESLEQDKLDLITKEEELEAKYYNLNAVEKELFLKTEIRKKIQEEQELIKNKIDEKRNFENEIEKTSLMLSTKKETLLSNNRLIGQLEEQIRELKQLSFEDSLIPELEQNISEKKNQKDILNEKIFSINSETNMLNMKTEENMKTEQKISNLEKCPTCLQDVDAVYRANVLNNLHTDCGRNRIKIEELQQLKKSLAENLSVMNSEIISMESRLSDLKMLKVKLQSIDEKQSRKEEIEKNNSSLEKDMDLLFSHVESLKKTVSELEIFESTFQLKQKEFEQAVKEERQAEIKVAELKKEIDVFSKYIDELREKITRIKNVKKQLDYLISLENWLTKNFIPLISYIEKNVMVKLKKEFSELFNEWFSMLVSDNFNVHLDDDFTPIIEQHDYELDYAYMSGGERTAVALAYRLSLNQVINSFLSRIKTKDLVILDEPTDGFSEQQLDKMRDVLQQLNVAQLILVSHEQKIDGFVENIIRFKKDRGESRMDN